MGRTVKAPPRRRLADGTVPGGWWHETEQTGRIMCDLCPRNCSLKPGDRGFCFVRQNLDGEMVLTTYGRSTGFCVDPIEKKPLNHFLPGTAVLSFGTAGCNLGCKFCQNWDSSKSRAVDRASEAAEPATIAEAAVQLDCHSVAFTYNDPVIWAEYAIDTARACHERGIKTVAVTAGYITPEARGSFYEVMDAANVDLKAFSEEFYYQLTSAHLQPVLDTLAWLKHETDVWFEITNLIIPRENDALDEIRRMCDWLLEHVGDEVPLHFTAFHPDFRLRRSSGHAAGNTPGGLRHRPGRKASSTSTWATFTIRSTTARIVPPVRHVADRAELARSGAYHLRGDRCPHCDTRIAGRFLDQPGDWGRRRLPVRISQFADAPQHRVPFGPQTRETRTWTTSHDHDRSTDSSRESGPQLTERQKQLIFRAACEMVVSGVCQRAGDWSDLSLEGAAQQPVAGAFVTLKRGTHLRACCGFLGPVMPLIEALQNAAHRTATNDTRLPPISPTELPYLHLDISLLHNFQPVTQTGAARIQAVAVGRHGLTIHRAEAGGLLLPVVAVEDQLGCGDLLATRLPQSRPASRCMAGRRCAVADIRSGAHRGPDRPGSVGRCAAGVATSVPPGGHPASGRALSVECDRTGAGGDPELLPVVVS